MKVVLLAVLLGLAWAKPPPPRRPMENPGMFEGDMYGVDISQDRNAIPRDDQRWVGGVVPYVVEGNLQTYWTQLKAGMDHIAQRTCIKFVPRTTQKDYVRMFIGDGCYSNWGRVGGAQVFSLGAGCYDIGTVVHELLHAIGFEHEHNRSDRDDYLIVNWNNVAEKWHYAFYKLAPTQNRLLTSFDFDSVMLYGQTAFSLNPPKKSMEAKDGRFMPEVYHKKGMSSSDITRVKMLYQC